MWGRWEQLTWVLMMLRVWWNRNIAKCLSMSPEGHLTDVNEVSSQ